MRLTALTVCLLALSALAFAPAPVPRPDRVTPAQKRERRLEECSRRLDELGVKWELVRDNEGLAVRFTLSVRGVGNLGGTFGVSGDRDLVNTLPDVIREVDDFYRRGGPPLPPP